MPGQLLKDTLELLKTRDENLKLKVIIFLKESGWGKAPQAHELVDENGIRLPVEVISFSNGKWEKVKIAA